MKHTHGPLPSGWHISENGHLVDDTNYCRFVLLPDKKIDRDKVAVILENHGYKDLARRWYLSPLEAAAPEMLEALKAFVDIQESDALAEHEWEGCGGVESCVLCMANAAINKAEGR